MEISFEDNGEDARFHEWDWGDGDIHLGSCVRGAEVLCEQIQNDFDISADVSGRGDGFDVVVRIFGDFYARKSLRDAVMEYAKQDPRIRIGLAESLSKLAGELRESIVAR